MTEACGNIGDGAYQITAPYFVALVVVHDGIVVDAAPILKWAKNKRAGEVWKWFRTRAFTWQRLETG